MRQPNGPADDPWWRFTPQNRRTGYLNLLAAACCLLVSIWVLFSSGGPGTAGTVFFAVLGVIAVLWLIRSANGLKAFMRDRALMSPGERVWPATDPWWRFTPRNRVTGWLALVAALGAVVESAWSLLAGGLDTRSTVFYALFAVVGVLWLVSATTGLIALLRDHTRR